jgi:hypothetical protein
MNSKKVLESNWGVSCDCSGKILENNKNIKPGKKVVLYNTSCFAMM